MIMQKTINIRNWVMGVLLFHLFTFSPLSAVAQGLPLLRNYTAQDYHAHNFNFDVNTGVDGMVFIANFEGLLYYDNVEWHTIYTPGYTRVTVVYRDQKDSIWAGGYNYIGKIRYQENGEPYLQRVGQTDAFQGEVQEITEHEGRLFFAVNDGKVYQADGDKVVFKRDFNQGKANIGLFDVVNIDAMIEGKDGYLRTDTTQVLPLDNGQNVVVRKDKGLFITDSHLRELYSVSENNGLCSNAIVWVEYDGKGCLWGATENGVFSLALPSAYSRYSATEGLRGEVLSMYVFQDQLYVGTMAGLFKQEGTHFVHIPGFDLACWQLDQRGDALLAATSNGVYRIRDEKVEHLTTASTTSILLASDGFYSGEIDGVYFNASNGAHTKVLDLESVTAMKMDKEGTLWLRNLYGEVGKTTIQGRQFAHTEYTRNEDLATFVYQDGIVTVITVDDEEPFPYPGFRLPTTRACYG